MNNITKSPEAFVTKAKQRIKQFDQDVYLKDGDEFEIELFNPLSQNVLAKIELNNQSIGSGIILRPGERVFLERYIDKANKFAFKTYSVDGNDQQVLEAIQYNGLVSISFYNEKIVDSAYYNNLFWVKFTPAHHTTTTYDNITTKVTTHTTTTYDNVSYTSNVKNFYENPNNVLRSSSLNDVTLDSLETGRIEEGSHSNQSFNTVNKEFYPFAFKIIKWHIKPENNITKDQIKSYCTECGAKKRKDSHKFCPHCGTKY